MVSVDKSDALINYDSLDSIVKDLNDDASKFANSNDQIDKKWPPMTNICLHMTFPGSHRTYLGHPITCVKSPITCV